LQNLRAQVEEMRKKQAMSQKVDAGVLRQKLVQEQVRQESKPKLAGITVKLADLGPSSLENAFGVDDFGSPGSIYKLPVCPSLL